MRKHTGDKQADHAPLRRQQPVAASGLPDRSSPADTLLALNHTHGNRVVQRLLTHTTHNGLEPAPEVEQAIDRARGGGHTLDSEVRRQMEPAFGADFSGVRVHADDEAHSLREATICS